MSKSRGFTMPKNKVLKKALSGSKNIRFEELIALLESFGFELKRTEGSHYIFRHSGIPFPFSAQSVQGKAKPYQVNQLLKLIEEYNLQLGADSEDKEQ